MKNKRTAKHHTKEHCDFFHLFVDLVIDMSKLIDFLMGFKNTFEQSYIISLNNLFLLGLLPVNFESDFV